MTKPPYIITDEIINLVAIISNKLGKIEASLDKKKDLLLRKISIIKSVNSSCAIEANTLTEKEVESVIKGKKIIAPLDKILEIKNAYDAYLNISSFKQYEITSFLEAHKYMMNNLKDDAGKLRTNDVDVYDKDHVVHIGARPQFINNLIIELFDWAKESKLNTLIKACIIHYEIEMIHPFSDGNGLIGRLWQSVILYNYNKLFELIPIETLVYENQQQYYQVISFSREQNSSTPFIEFMLEMILKTIEDFEEKIIVNKIKSNYANLLSKNEKILIVEILSYFDCNEVITIEQVEAITNKKAPNLRKYFRHFTKYNILIPIGNSKGRTYLINKQIIDKTVK